MSEWYYMYGGEQQGPVNGTQLKALAATGALGPDDLVWNQSMTEWAAARRVRGLNFAGKAKAAAQPAAAPALAAPMTEAYEEASAEQPLASAVPADFSPTANSEKSQLLGYSAPAIEGVSANTLELLRQTMPWVRIVSIVLFIQTGFILLAATIMLIAMFTGGALASRLSGAAGVAMGAVGVFVFVVYLGVAALIFFPGLFLSRYATRIRQLLATRRVMELESALAAQKAYWMFVGILSLIVCCFFALGIILNIVMVIMH